MDTFEMLPEGDMCRLFKIFFYKFVYVGRHFFVSKEWKGSNYLNDFETMYDMYSCLFLKLL